MLKTINIPLFDAQEITKLGSNSVIISINNYYEPIPFFGVDRNSSKVLTVKFDDVHCDAAFGDKKVRAIESDTAHQIVNFIENWQNKNFIVHCTAGISRSAAVCLFINLAYGHELKENFWKVSHPNPLVLGMLIRVWKFKQAQ